MRVGAPGATSQGFYAAVRLRQPEVNARPHPVMPSGSFAHAMPERELNQRLPKLHVLGYPVHGERVPFVSRCRCNNSLTDVTSFSSLFTSPLTDVQYVWYSYT